MKKIILAATIIGFTMGGALAQGTGPASQNNMKPNDTMSKDGMKKDSTSGTSGMSQDSMSKDGMKKDGMMNKNNKPADGMKK